MALRINSFCVKDPHDPKTTRPHQLPIYATSSFEFQNIQEGMDIFKDPSRAHLYGRFSNPTVDAVAQKIADLESYNCPLAAPFGIMTSSGMSAISTLFLSLLKVGDQILTQGNLYGGTTELIKKVMTRSGIQPIYTDLRRTEDVKRAISENSRIKLIYFETPSNPALDCIDIGKISEIAHDNQIMSVIDNTFCTPLIQQPFLYRVDYVIHSTTKYLNGHGNSVAGIIVGHGEENREKVWSTMKLLGTNCNAFDAWLTNNGLKTLALRMNKHSENALLLSRFLESHKKVKSVRYLGLDSHEDHELASRQMSSFGGMMCFEVKGGIEGGMAFMNRVTIGALAPTLGDVDTLVMHPASMSHLNVDKKVRLKNGITDSLIRVSVGIEDIQDLIEDFDKALTYI